MPDSMNCPRCSALENENVSLKENWKIEKGWAETYRVQVEKLDSKVHRLEALVRKMAKYIDTCVICDCDPDLQITCESCELVNRAKAELEGK